MFCAARKPNRSRFAVIANVLALGAALVASFVVTSPATTNAITNVNAQVHDNAPASLVVNPVTPITPSSSISISGSIHNISQIMVYINGAYNSTMPIDFGASDFTLALMLNPGTNTIKLVGIDPQTAAQVEHTLTVVYDPQPTVVPQTPAAVIDGAVTKAGGVVVQSGQAMQTQIDQASASGPMEQLSDAGFMVLQAFDLVSVRDSSGVNSMGARFSFILIGLILVFIPWQVYTLASRIKIVPKRTERDGRITTILRVVGAILVLLPFVFSS